jgi:hypothetical protein
MDGQTGRIEGIPITLGRDERQVRFKETDGQEKGRPAASAAMRAMAWAAIWPSSSSSSGTSGQPQAGAPPFFREKLPGGFAGPGSGFSLMRAFGVHVGRLQLAGSSELPCAV